MPLPILHHVERNTSYIPPVYAIRFVRSLATLALFGLPAIIGAFVAARRQPADAGARIRRAVVVWLLIIAAGAFIAATDAMNDEGWNPTFYGGPFVAASLPAALAVAVSRDDSHRAAIVVLALLIAFPFALLVSGLASALVQWAFDRGVPLTW